MITRRSLLAAAPLPSVLARMKNVPVGIELYSVRDRLKADLPGTVTAVAKMGYQVVEFYSPYFDWTASQAKEVRKLLDDLGIKALSTHNSARVYDPANLDKAIELNAIIGSSLVVMASSGGAKGLDAWKTVAERLTWGAERLKAAGMRAGYHNHAVEFRPDAGVRPIELIARNTPREVVLQLDVGTCIEAGSDPVAWIAANPRRIASMHCKDWAPADSTRHPAKGYEVLFGEGVAPWKKLFAAGEKTGGIECYLLEQEGSRFDSLETARRCLATFRAMRG
jgi:sugar phosphate isomerase/epimerase